MIQNKMECKKENFGELIDVYTRTQALSDGVLVDVTETAQETGIVYPTAITRELWNEYIVPREEAPSELNLGCLYCNILAGAIEEED